jgi:hypothetical protein
VKLIWQNVFDVWPGVKPGFISNCASSQQVAWSSLVTYDGNACGLNRDGGSLVARAIKVQPQISQPTIVQWYDLGLRPT